MPGWKKKILKKKKDSASRPPPPDFLCFWPIWDLIMTPFSSIRHPSSLLLRSHCRWSLTFTFCFFLPHLLYVPAPFFVSRFSCLFMCDQSNWQSLYSICTSQGLTGWQVNTCRRMLRSDRYNHVRVLNHQLFFAVLGLRSQFFLKRGNLQSWRIYWVFWQNTKLLLYALL